MNREFDICIEQLLNPYCNNGIRFLASEHPLESSNLIIEDDSSLEKRFNVSNDEARTKRTTSQIASLLFGEICEELTTKLQQTARVIIFETPQIEQSFFFDRNPDKIILKSRFNSISSMIQRVRHDNSWTNVEKWQLVEELINKFKTTSVSPPEFGDRTTLLFQRFDFQENILHETVKNRVFNVYLHIFPFRFEINWINGAFVVKKTVYNALLGDRIQIALSYMHSFIQQSKSAFVNVEWRLFHSRALAFGVSLTALLTWQNAYPTKVINMTLSVANQYYLSPRSFLLFMTSKIPAESLIKNQVILNFYLFVMIVWRFVPLDSMAVVVIDQTLNKMINTEKGEITSETMKTLVTDTLKTHFHSQAFKEWEDDCFELPIADSADGFWSYISESLPKFADLKKQSNVLASKLFDSVIFEHVKPRDFFENRALLALKVARLFEMEFVKTQQPTKHLEMDLKTKSGKIHQLPPTHFLKNDTTILAVLNDLVLFLLSKSETATMVYYISRVYNFEISETTNWMRLFGKDFISYHATAQNKNSFIGIDWSWGNYYGKETIDKYSQIEIPYLQRDTIDKRWSFSEPGQLVRTRKLKGPEYAVISIFFPSWLISGTTAKLDLFQAREAMIDVLATQIRSRIFYGFSDQDISFVSSKFLTVLHRQVLKLQKDDTKRAVFALCQRTTLETISSLFFAVKCFSVHPRYRDDWKESIYTFLLYRIAPDLIKPPLVKVYTLDSTELRERLDQIRTRVPTPPKKQQKRSPNKNQLVVTTTLEDENWALAEQKRKAEFKELYLRMMKYGFEKNVDTSLRALVEELIERIDELKQVVELLKTDESQTKQFAIQTKRLEHMQRLLFDANTYLEKEKASSKNKRAVLLSKYPAIAKQQGVSTTTTTITTVVEETMFKTPEKADPEKSKNEEATLLVALALWEYSEELNRSLKDNNWFQTPEHIVQYLHMARHLIHYQSPFDVICIPRSSWEFVKDENHQHTDKKFLVERIDTFELNPTEDTKYEEYYDNRYRWLSNVKRLEDVLFLSHSSITDTSKMNGATSIYRLIEKMDNCFVKGEKLPDISSAEDFQISTSDPILHFRASLSFLPLEFVQYAFSASLQRMTTRINNRLITSSASGDNQMLARNFAFYIGNDHHFLFLRWKNFAETRAKNMTFFKEELVAKSSITREPSVYHAFYIPHKFQLFGLDESIENPYDDIWQERYQLLPTIISKIKFHEYKRDEEGKTSETLEIPGVFYVMAKSVLKNRKHVGGIPLIIAAVLFDHSVISPSFDKLAFVSYLVHYNYIFQWEKKHFEEEEEDEDAFPRIRTLFDFDQLRAADANLYKPDTTDLLDYTNFLNNQSFLNLLVENKVPRLTDQRSFDDNWHFDNHRNVNQVFDYAKSIWPIENKETIESLGKQYMTRFISQEEEEEEEEKSISFKPIDYIIAEMENAETFEKSFLHLFQWFMNILNQTLVHIRQLHQKTPVDASFRIELAISFLGFLLSPFQVPYSRFYFDWIKNLQQQQNTTPPVMKLNQTTDLNALLWRVFQQHPLQLDSNLPDIDLNASTLAKFIIDQSLGSQKWEMIVFEPTEETYEFDFLVDEQDRTEEEFLELESNENQQTAFKFRKFQNDFEVAVKTFTEKLYGQLYNEMNVNDLLSGGILPIDNESVNGIRQVLNGDEDTDMLMTDLKNTLSGDHMARVITFLDKKCDISFKQISTFVSLNRIGKNNEFMEELYTLCAYLFGFFQKVAKDKTWKFTTWGRTTKAEQHKMAVPVSKKDEIGPNQAPLVKVTELYDGWQQLVKQVILDFNIVSLYEETQTTQISGDKLLSSFILQMNTLRENAKRLIQVYVPYKPSGTGNIIQLKAEDLEHKTRSMVQEQLTRFSQGLLSLAYRQKMSHQDYLSNKFYNLAMQKKVLEKTTGLIMDKQRELAHRLFYFPDDSTERIGILDQKTAAELRVPANADEVKIVLKVRVVKRDNIAFLTPDILFLIQEKVARLKNWEKVNEDSEFVKKNLVVLVKFELAQRGVASGEKYFFYEPLVWNLE